MSQKYSIAEARSRLPSIVDQAEAGVEIELTRRGQPVAVLVSHREFERLRGKRLHFRDAYRKFLKTHPLQEIGVDDDFAAAARDRTTGREVSLLSSHICSTRASSLRPCRRRPIQQFLSV